MEQTKRHKGCYWPMWKHGDRPNHEYCGERREPGSSYCAKHRAMSIRDFADEPQGGLIGRLVWCSGPGLVPGREDQPVAATSGSARIKAAISASERAG